MARIVFLLLVFANLAVYVWAAGYLGGRDDGREPERLRNQLQPERLRVSVGDTPASTDTTPPKRPLRPVAALLGGFGKK